MLQAGEHGDGSRENREATGLRILAVDNFKRSQLDQFASRNEQANAQQAPRMDPDC
jgi:hypothetical protein